MAARLSRKRLPWFGSDSECPNERALAKNPRVRPISRTFLRLAEGAGLAMTASEGASGPARSATLSAGPGYWCLLRYSGLLRNSRLTSASVQCSRRTLST